jgi:tetratricopeptide (TPR) repeat protein
MRVPAVVSLTRALAVAAFVLAAGGCSTDSAKQRRFEAGDRHFAAGHYKEAILEFRSAVALDERWGEARVRLAEAYARDGDPENAFQQYIRAADLMPDDTNVQLKAATYLLLGGRYEDARARAEGVLAKTPTSVDALIVLGNVRSGLRDLDGALAQFEEAIELDPGRSQSYTNLALVKAAKGELGQARDAFERAVAVAPTSVPALLALANFQWSTGDVAAVGRSLEQAFELDRGHVVTNRAMAAFYRAVGRAADAERHLKFLADASPNVAEQFTLADYYVSERRWDDARRVLEPLQTNIAAAGAAETRLAAIAYAIGERAAAQRMLDTLLERDPNIALAQLLKARWLMDDGRYEEAADHARRAVAASPRMAGAHYILGLVQARTHRAFEAIKSFTEVARFNPRVAAPHIQLSSLHLMRNAVDSAVLSAEEALRNAPDDLDAALALTRAWIARKDYGRADAALGALKKRSSPRAAVHSLAGSLAAVMKNTSQARTEFERALELDRSSFEAVAGLTTLDASEGRLQPALTRLEPYLESPSPSPPVLMLAAKVLMLQGDRTRSEQLLRQAIVADPLEPEAFSLLGRTLADQHKLDGALVEFDERGRLRPADLSARIMAAMIVHVQGNLGDAKRRYSEIVNLEPRAAIVANNLASIYANEGENLAYAQQLAERASEQLPTRPEIHDTLGWIYYRRELYGRAVARFESSVAAAPGNSVYHYHLGLAYSKNGQREKAREALRKAIALDPRSKDAQQALASLGA